MLESTKMFSDNFHKFGIPLGLQKILIRSAFSQGYSWSWTQDLSCFCRVYRNKFIPKAVKTCIIGAAALSNPKSKESFSASQSLMVPTEFHGQSNKWSMRTIYFLCSTQLSFACVFGKCMTVWHVGKKKQAQWVLRPQCLNRRASETDFIKWFCLGCDGPLSRFREFGHWWKTIRIRISSSLKMWATLLLTKIPEILNHCRVRVM